MNLIPPVFLALVTVVLLILLGYRLRGERSPRTPTAAAWLSREEAVDNLKALRAELELDGQYGRIEAYLLFDVAPILAWTRPRFRPGRVLGGLYLRPGRFGFGGKHLMTEKPIIFSGEMVRAILDGRKAQTRRVIKPQPPIDEHGDLDCGRILGPEMYHPAVIGKNGEMEPGAPVYGVYDDNGEWGVKCPYGQPGDRLWVRETWATLPQWDNVKPSSLPVGSVSIFYCDDAFGEFKKRPSIFMPRWASRITLRVTAVRVERVQDISSQDCFREGVDGELIKNPGHPSSYNFHRPFQHLWDSINAKRGYGWDANPWVWVVDFEKVG